MKKKIRTVLIAIAVLLGCMMLILSACKSKGAIYARTQYYTVYSQQGQWFMEFHPEHWYRPPTNASPSIAVSYPDFTSLSDMQSRIKCGKIDPYALSGLYYQSSDNIRKICNLSKLYNLVAPADFAYNRIVLWGEDYEFAADNSISPIAGSIVCATADSYEWHFDTYYTIHTANRRILADITTADRNARIVYYTGTSSPYKDNLYQDIFYEIQTGTQTLYIRESSVSKYLPDIHTKEALKERNISNSIPGDVYIYGHDGTNYFYGELHGFTKRPSVEWLSSFHLKPYTDPTPFIGISVGSLVTGAILAVAGYREKRRHKLVNEERTIR